MKILNTSHRLWLIGLCFCLFVSVAHAQNHVLSLDGDGDYVRIPNAPQLQGGENVLKTIEAWFMPKKTPFRVVAKTLDSMKKDWAINLNEQGQIQFHSEVRGNDYRPSLHSTLALNQWYHVAVVINRPQRWLRLYLNGVLVIEDTDMGDESATTEAPVAIGAYSYSSRFAEGYIDDVRIWNVPRTQAQIRKTMFTPLRGSEPGLVGYWPFEGQTQKVIDATGNGHDGELFGDAVRVAMDLPTRGELLTRDEIYQGYLQSLELDLSVQRNKPDELKDVLSITARRVPESTVWAPPPPLPVQIEIRDEASQLLTTLGAREGEPIAWTVPETVQGTLRILAGQTDRSGTTREARFTCRAHSTVPITPRVGRWKTYDVTDGLGSMVFTIVQDRNGTIWFGSVAGGGSRYDGQAFRTFTTQDGLPSDNIRTVYQDSRGVLWFGTMEYSTLKGAGVCKYDGETFQTFTTKDGLVDDAVMAIYEDKRGHLWFGTMRGVSEFDGATYIRNGRWAA